MVSITIIKLICCVFIVSKSKETIGKVSNRFVLVRNSSIFVDKTVLLKNVFKYDFLLLTVPHKFGKTTNLHMIKLFLGNSNSKAKVADVFRHTNIWRDRQFIVKHLCKYPIIYCDFMPNGTIETFEDVIKELKLSVSNTFLEHKYLLNSNKVCVATKKRYIEYCKLQVKDFEIALKFLSKVLHIHHGRRATVLIDNFDHAMTFSIFKKELDSTKTSNLLFRLIDNTINLNEYVEKCVIMGSIPFRFGAQFDGVYLLEHFKFMVTKDFTPYFGFTQRETEALLEKFSLGHLKSNVTSWYGGYSYLHSDFTIYNPWSVLMFLKTKKFDTHWISNTAKKMLYGYLEPHYELKEHFSNLVKQKYVTIDIVKSFTSYEIDKLKNVQFASISFGEDQTEDHLFIQILLESGYLTYAKKYRTLPISTEVKFPNYETQQVFEQVLSRLGAISPDINRY